MNYKLIALDLDGTLKNSQHTVSPRTKAALMKAQEAGAKLVLASGRPTDGLRGEAENLKLEQYGGYLLAFNGSCVTDVCTKKILFRETLTVEEAVRVYDRAKELGLGCLTYRPGTSLTEDVDNDYVRYEARLNEIELNRVSFKESLRPPIYKVLTAAEPEHIAKVLPEFQASFAGELSIYRSAPWFIDAMPMGIDKGYALKKLAETLGIPREQIMAFGDEHNDVSMLAYAGMGIAMGNAVEAAKKAADFITKSNDEDGIACALERFMGESKRTVV